MNTTMWTSQDTRRRPFPSSFLLCFLIIAKMKVQGEVIKTETLGKVVPSEPWVYSIEKFVLKLLKSLTLALQIVRNFTK